MRCSRASVWMWSWAEDIIDRQNAHALEQQDDSRGLFIRQVNVAHRMVCQQLYDHPLFSTVDARASSRKKLEVLVLGCGTLGAEFARTSLYAGQMPGVSVRVTAVDQLETQALLSAKRHGAASCAPG